MSDRVLVCGMAQEGKTTYAFKLLLARSPRLFVLDPARSRPFSSPAEDADVGIRPPQARVFVSYPEVSTFFLSPEATRQWVVILRSQDEQDYIDALRFAKHYRHVTLLVDEAIVFTDNPDALDPLIKVVRMGAHYGGGTGCHVWITAQRPMDLPPDIRSQFSCCYSFRQDEPHDLDYLAKKFSPDFATQVAGLAPHQLVMFPPDPKAIRESTTGELQGNPGHDGDRARHAVGGQQIPSVGVPQADRRLKEDTHENASAPAD